MALMPPKRCSARLAIAVLITLALLPRICVVLAPRADLYGPAKVDSPTVYIGEEVARGNVALELIRGPLLPVLDYQYGVYWGGTLVESVLTVPAFLLFGPRLWAIKLIPIALHLVTLALMFLILDRFASRRAAWIGGLLFALTPPAYTLLSTVAWGSHIESHVLAMLSVLLFLDLCTATRARSWRRAAFGLVGGFSVWFGYQCLIFLAALCLFDFLLDRRFLLRKEMLAQAGGFLIGFSPWIVYNLRFDFAGLNIYGSSFTEHVTAAVQNRGPVARVFDLALKGFPRSFFFRPMWGVGTTALGALCAVALIAAAAMAAWHLRMELKDLLLRAWRPAAPRQAPNPALIALVYCTGFVLCIALTDFGVGEQAENIRQYRYAMLVFPFLYIAAAVGLDQTFNRWPGMVRPGWALVAMLCLLSTAGVLRYCDSTRIGADRNAPGSEPEGMGRWYLLRFCDRLDKLERVVENATVKRTPKQQEQLYTGMARILKYLTAPGRKGSDWDRKHIEDIRRARTFLASHVPEPFRAQFVE